MSKTTEQQHKLPRTRLGDTGLIVSRPSLGTMSIGDNEEEHLNAFGMKIATKSNSIKILDEYYNRGGNFIDTANIYDNGGSERVIGLWLNKKREEGVVDIRDKIVLATKCFFPFGTDSNQRGLTKHSIKRSLEESLKRLQTDYVDLYIAHSYDSLTPIEETLRAFNQLIESGKIRYWGVSNWSTLRIVQAVERCKANGWVPPCNAQMQYSLLVRDIENDFVQACIEYGISITAWGPLFSGWLSGRVTREKGTNESDRAKLSQNMSFDIMKPRNIEKAYDVVDKLLEVSKHQNKPPSQVAIRWLIDNNPKVQVIPIIGSNNINHIIDGLDSESFVLTQESVKALDKVSQEYVPYPHNMLNFTGGTRTVDVNYYN